MSPICEAVHSQTLHTIPLVAEGKLVWRRKLGTTRLIGEVFEQDRQGLRCPFSATPSTVFLGFLAYLRTTLI